MPAKTDERKRWNSCTLHMLIFKVLQNFIHWGSGLDLCCTAERVKRLHTFQWEKGGRCRVEKNTIGTENIPALWED